MKEMRDKYLEQFHANQQSAKQELSKLAARFSETGVYSCGGGFVVWAG